MDLTEAQIQIFVDTAAECFTHATSRVAEASAPYALTAQTVLLDYTAEISVSGKSKGAVYFTACAPFLDRILQVMGDSAQIGEEAAKMDLTGEIANILSGNVRRHFGSSFSISVPKTGRGPDAVNLPSYMHSVVIPIMWEGFECRVIICLGHSSAVYGALEDMPLSEILGMAARGAGGRLRLRELPENHTVEIQVQQGNLRRMLVDGEEVDGTLNVRLWVNKLIQCRQGYFELLREPQPDEGALSLPVKQLIMSAMPAEDSPGSAQEKHYPLPETVFVMSANRTYWVDSATELFLESAESALAEGASALTLSRHTGMPVSEIVAKLHRLHTAGFIAPARAFKPAAFIPEQATAAAPKQPLPPVASKAHVLTSIHAPVPPSSRTATELRKTTQLLPARQVHSPASDLGLIGRFLSGLKRRLCI